MPAINADTIDAWRQLAHDVAPQRLSKGKRVRVTSGKHTGKEGLVTWHGRNRYSDAWRYADSAQMHLREMVGRYGFRVRIDTGEEVFFVDADKVEVLNELLLPLDKRKSEEAAQGRLQAHFPRGVVQGGSER